MGGQVVLLFMASTAVASGKTRKSRLGTAFHCEGIAIEITVGRNQIFLWPWRHDDANRTSIRA